MKAIKLLNLYNVLFVVVFTAFFADAKINLCGGLYRREGISATSRSVVQSEQAVLAAREKYKGQISFKDLMRLKPDLINYFKSFGKGKQIVIFTGATSLEKDFVPKSIWNLRRPVKKQTSGVVTVMQVMAKDIEQLTGVKIKFVTPEQFGIHYQIKYQDIFMVHPLKKELAAIIDDPNNVAFHLMVEDQLGSAAQSMLKRKGLPYSTAYHTDFPQYAAGFVDFYVPSGLSKLIINAKTYPFIEKGLYAFLRKFHSKSAGIMVPTKTMYEKLIENGFNPEQLRLWSHGVDLNIFHPSKRDDNLYAHELGIDLDGRPVALFVGRIGEEKNIRDFLDADLTSEVISQDGRVENKTAVKVIIGSGPELEILKAEYPNAYFIGRKAHDTELPKYMASADAFVFTSLTETFGLVGPEALASGTPTLTYKVQGMKDWNYNSLAGKMVDYTPDRKSNLENLSEGWRELMKLKREEARAFAETMPWERSMLEFLFFIRPAASLETIGSVDR